MRRKAFRIGFVVAVWVPTIVIVGGLARGGAADFSGFEMASKATAALFTFDSPSLGIPAKPTGELNFGYSETSLRSGPSAYGLGSILWPGQVAAAVPSFLQADIERQSGQKFPVNIPNYPVRAESFHPQGPATTSTDFGTMHMSSTAKETAAEGTSYVNRFAFPGIGLIGNQTSMSSSGFDSQGAVSMAEAAANDVSLFGGMVKIGSVVTRLTARSDGVKATVAGTTEVGRAEVAGNAVVIDATGVHVADQGIDAVAAQQAVNQALASTGISIELGTAIDTIQGPQGSRALGGLLIRAKSSALEPLVAALPPDLQSQIRGQLTLDQEFTIQLAPAAVTAGAAKNIEFPVDAPDLGGTTGDETPAAVGEPALPSGTSGGSAPSGAVGQGGGPVVVQQVSTTFEGVPVWLVVLLMIAAFVSSRPLMALADRLLSARAGAGGCPNGGD
ncbi:MAG TPA: hypothetical protein VFA34_05220 [Actinomycetota bacterium]|jgi:hypothetical protein|nr:hypothetical protein [Actinomycetota bacterium]